MALLELQTQLREVSNVVTSTQTIARSLHRVGYTMKTVRNILVQPDQISQPQPQITHPALERNEEDREEFKAIMASEYYPEQLVFADESHFNRLTLRRPFAWSIRGQRAVRLEYSHHGVKYSILPAICLDGILHLEVVENAVTDRRAHV